MRSGFFNSNITGFDEYGNPIYDRAEEASFFAEFFADFIGNGVYPNPSTGMQVLANEGMTLLIQQGRCFINGYRGKVEEGGEIIELEGSDSNYPRIDRIVARLDIEAREIEPKVLKGIPATTPVAIELTRNSNIHEIALADVTIAPNVSTITQANITDTRLNSELCGMVSAVIDQLDTTTLFNQYQTWFQERMKEADKDYNNWFNNSEKEFTEWFNTIKDKLSEADVAVLQREIDNKVDKSSVINNLNSSSSTDVLSANQGKILKEKIDLISKANIMTATGTNTNVKLQETKINLNSNVVVGDKLSISNGGIKIGVGVSVIKFNTAVVWSNATSGTKAILMYKNNTNSDNQLARMLFNLNTSNQPTLELPPKLANVEEGDIIYLYCTDSAGADIAGALSYVTVEVVE